MTGSTQPPNVPDADDPTPTPGPVDREPGHAGDPQPGAAASSGSFRRRGTVVNALIVLAVAALAVAPLTLSAGDQPFTGSDAQAETAITENAPGYEPWWNPLYEPPSGEVESAMFALQAALGAGVLGYTFGVYRTRRKLAATRPGD